MKEKDINMDYSYYEGHIKESLMKKRIVIIMCLLWIVCLIGIVRGETVEQESISIEQNQPINIMQVCENSTYSYLTAGFVSGQNTNLITSQLTMNELSDDTYNYTWTSTSNLGTYYFYGICDEDKERTTWGVSYSVSPTGNVSSSSQLSVVIAQIAVIALFIAIGFGFSKEKWKLRAAFFSFALLMGIVALNSIRVMAGSSSVLGNMGNMGVIVGIIAFAFIIVYVMVYYLTDVFKNFKKKRRDRWEVNSNPY